VQIANWLMAHALAARRGVEETVADARSAWQVLDAKRKINRARVASHGMDECEAFARVFCARTKTARQAAGMTQAQLAAAMEISERTVQRRETTRRMPACRLVAFTQISVPLSIVSLPRPRLYQGSLCRVRRAQLPSVSPEGAEQS
jgi:DNA-binding XRE family transcriptional regulator